MKKLQSLKPTFTCLPNWLRGKVLPSEGWLLWILKSHYPNIFPSIQTLAEESGMSERTVITVLKSLETHGLIRKINPFQAGVKRRSNTYELLVDQIPSQMILGEERPVSNLSSTAKSAGVAPQNPQSEHRKICSGSYAKFADKEEQSKNSKIKKPKLKKDSSQEKLLLRKTPFYSPKGENRDFSDPWFDEEPAIEKQISHQRPVEKLQAPPSTTVPTTAKAVLALPPAVELPASVQPQPQQPVKPWESTPAPLHSPSAEPALVETAAEPKPRRQKAPRFVASEELIPAALLPVRDELLKFWAEKEGKKSEKAWAHTIRGARAIQDDPRGGTEILRRQLRQGAADGWQGLSFANWERYGEKARPQQASSGQASNDPAPWRQEGLRGYDLVAAALALSKARDALNGQRHAEAHQQALQGLPEASPCVVEAELVA